MSIFKDPKIRIIQWIFNTGPYVEPPLKIKILKIGLRSDLRWPKLGLEPKFYDPGTFGGFGTKFYPISSGYLTLDHMGTPLKIKILKSGFLHAREDQKIGPEPKFHVPRSSNGKD